MSTTEFSVPTLGEHNDIPENELPIGTMRVCQNFLRNEKGRLVIRPGYGRLTSTNPTERIMGIGHWRTTAATERFVAGTTSKLWAFNYSTRVWENKTGATALSGTFSSHIKFVTMPVGGVYKIIAMNGIDATQIWDGTAATFSDLTGAPVAMAGTLIANRLLLLTAPNVLRVSDFNDPTNWPVGSGFTIALADSGDLMIATDQLTRTATAVLGEESQWIARAQSGSNPIRVERISNFPGPLSAAALVRVGAVVYWLALNYNVYKFDGVSTVPVGNAMRSWVKANISLTDRQQTHGIYMDDLGKVFWFFPQSGAIGPNVGIYLDVTTGEMGRLKLGDIITASGRVRISTTITWADLAGYTWDDLGTTFPSWNSFGDPASDRKASLGASTGDVFISDYGDGSDNGHAIEGILELPLKSYAGWDQAVIPETFETFFKKTTLSTPVESALGWTDTLMDDQPTYSPLPQFDLNVDQRNDIDLTSVSQKRYVSLRHRVIAPKGGVEWQGGILRFESEEIEHGPTGSQRGA